MKRRRRGEMTGRAYRARVVEVAQWERLCREAVRESVPASLGRPGASSWPVRPAGRRVAPVAHPAVVVLVGVMHLP